ncbi:MAG: LUD domain-containing protein [[Clostridium] scindens]
MGAKFMTATFSLQALMLQRKTGDGFNIDGFGSGVCHSRRPSQSIIMIVGMNKVVRDIENAVSGARNEAAPINAQRFDIDTPCHKTGACFDCKSPDTICCQMLVTRFSKVPERIKVILVNEELGF